MTLRDSLPYSLVNPRASAFETERFNHFVGEFLVGPQASIGLNPIYHGEQFSLTVFIDAGPCGDARPWTPRIWAASGTDIRRMTRAILSGTAGVRTRTPS